MFQAKNDYGYDLGQQLSQQAAGELAYVINVSQFYKTILLYQRFLLKITFVIFNKLHYNEI